MTGGPEGWLWVGNSVSKRKQTLQLTGPVFFPGDGFIVYDPNKKIISRFDSYGPDSEPKDELVILMDATGNGLLTLHRKDVDPTSEEFSS